MLPVKGLKSKKRKYQVKIEIIVDNFAGGGGASDGIEAEIGRSIDIAINHDKDAVAMHEANHPNTKHYCEDVFEVDPIEAAAGRPVALCWLSPDCKHFSKAKGGTPVSQEIRGLAWVGVKWAAQVGPRVIMLENVEEFKTWGPLIDDGNGGKKPDPERKGEIFKSFVKILSTGISKDDEGFMECLDVLKIDTESILAYKLSKGLGYDVEWKELKACDYGAPTTRKRLFLIARCDNQPIVWPEPTHAPRDSEEAKKGLKESYRSASEVIDFTIPGKSIFNRKKPLVDSTMKRIARGLFKFVIDEPDPFIIPESLTENSTEDEQCIEAPTLVVNTSGHSGSDLRDPIKTITTGGHHALMRPVLLQMGYGDQEGKRVLDLDKPLGTITSGGNKFGLATAWIKEDYGNGIGTDIKKPLGTITAKSNHHSIMTAFLTKHYGGYYQGAGVNVRDPLGTITQIDHHGMVSLLLREKDACSAISRKFSYRDPMNYSLTRNLLKTNVVNSLEVEQFLRKYMSDVEGVDFTRTTAFLVKYYGNDVGQSLDQPLHTIPTRDRFGLVTIEGVDYQIVDITFRMLEPHELKLAQGVRSSYIIDQDKDGKKISKSKQIARIGNMVVPQCASALVRSNLPEMCVNEPFAEQVELLNADSGW